MTKTEEVKNKYCTKCGKELEEKNKFCPYCGQEVPQIEKEEKKTRKKNSKIEEAKIEEVKKADKVEEPKEVPETIEVEQSTPKETTMSPTIEETPSKQGNFESKKKYIYPVIAVVCTFILCLGAFTCFYKYYLKNLVIETTKREVTVTDTGISEAVEKVYDSVVVVESYVKGQLYATGTGFVYKTDDKVGYILTNNHVIENADSIKVVFTNNKRESVELVGKDSYSDIALLAVDKEKVLAVAEIGSSEALKVGDTSFAVGAPLDSSTYAWTVTRGVISGKNRTVSVSASNGYQSSSYVMEVLQTDAAINNGNSGGPLCNSNGEVIGITNMKLASSTIEGMGFAIPIETAVKNADKFIKGENVSYPYLGVTLYNATPTYSNPTASGVYIESVEKNSPADKGGLKAGDKILKVNDAEVSDVSFFKYELYKYNTGDKVTITVERNDKEKELEITLGSSNTTT